MPQNPLLFISVDGLDVAMLTFISETTQHFPLGKGKETSNDGQKSSCSQALVCFAKLQA